MTKITKYFIIIALATVSVYASNAQAETNLPAPHGRVVLEVSGVINNHTNETEAQFDLAQLKKFQPVTITTSTPWTEGVVTFVGVSIEDLLAYVDAQGDTLLVTALNDYTATMPANQLTQAGAILAYELDGQRLSVRDKGPLWVMFPFDANEAYQTDAYWAYAVWQVKSIIIE